MKILIIGLCAAVGALAGLCWVLWRREREADRIMRTLNETNSKAWLKTVHLGQEIERLRKQILPDGYGVIERKRVKLQKLRLMTFVHIWDIEDMQVNTIQRKVNLAVDEVLEKARNAVVLCKRERPDGSVDIRATLYVAVPEQEER